MTSWEKVASPFFLKYVTQKKMANIFITESRSY